ncbi:protein translocase subunit SecD [Brucepastera parasyntrophica]|uniref:protein translocase subunit SecD n=1 Tax=Brucepastera parasyntrophica TaxID=2880008 RepID=UPI00210B3738|nr:protein translocase subunit SecD [Brucepastera parasyntrophica]ULQ60368.1 protein translocase subunit SecD [Brucepastera parasyntrophica]
MNKRSRFLLILVVLAVCFVCLWPSVKWYFLTPKEDQSLALGSREKIRDYAHELAAEDVRQLISDARADTQEPVDAKFKPVIKVAKKNYKAMKKPVPSVWTARAFLDAFPSEADILSYIEADYRDRILALKRTQANSVKLGLDLSGGMSIVIKADLEAAVQSQGGTITDMAAFKRDAMNQVMETLTSRIDRFGLSEPVIRRQGEDRIYIEIPGAADSDRINSIIMGKGILAFHMVDNDATNQFLQYYAQFPTSTFDSEYNLLNPDIIPSGTQVMGYYVKDSYGIDERRGFLVIKSEPGLEGKHIKNVETHSDRYGQPAVTFSLDSEGAQIFADLTANNVGETLAIVSEDKIKSYASIRQAIPNGQVEISGFSAEEAENIKAVLRTASINVPLELESQQVIGASMGDQAIRQALWSLIFGLAAVFVFLLIYYKGAGINACVAQILNMYIVFSILSAFNLTLTLPSVAGMILTIGMAVDANVVIFERIKDELKLKKGREAAINAGFSHAFWAIMDSNITTFIAAIFLSILGSGPVKGFAYTLAIGVASSVFTALFVSRLLFDFNTDVLKKKTISISWRIK